MVNVPKMNALSILCVLTVVVTSAIADRKVYGELNPGCLATNHCLNISKLAYVRAEGDNDTLHFLFDFTFKPSLVILTTVKDDNIFIDYMNPDIPINFTKTPLYTFATVFNNLYEFNDVNNTGKIENGNNFTTLDFRGFNWNEPQLKNFNNESVEVTISSNSFRRAYVSKSGIVSITLKVYGKKDKGSNLPHLIHTPESGEMTLTLDQLQTSFNKSRFAVELLTVSSFPYNKSEELSSNTFSDDKSAGGAFYNYLVDAKGEDKEEGGGYLSWKPVVYKAANTHALNSSSTIQYAVRDHLVSVDWLQTPLCRLFGNNFITDNSHYLKKSNNVSFGKSGDEFYAKSNYLYWTFLVGVGAPPNSSLGFLEMSIIATLLLMLTITMILIFCIFMRWMSNKRNAIIYGK